MAAGTHNHGRLLGDGPWIRQGGAIGAKKDCFRVQTGY